MAKTSHSDGDVVGKFCTQRKKSCSMHGNQYRECCRVPWTFDAHHVLCVASVTQYISADDRITKVVKLTPWCINTLDNMLALPRYLGTVSKFYINRLRQQDFSVEPGFKDLAVHTYDHLSTKGYKNDIDTQMKKIANRAAISKKKHEDTSTDLAAALNGYRNTMKTKLTDYGKRGAGTHKEFLKVYSGEKKPDSDWYVPFSMADPKGNIEAKTFPLTVTKTTADKVKKLVKALT